MSTQVYRLSGGVLGSASVPGEPLPSRTLFGCAVTALPNSGRTQEQEFGVHVAEVGNPAVYRHYDGGLPATWATTAAATYAGWEDRWTWTSLKPNVNQVAAGLLDEEITAWLESIPPARQGIRRMVTIHHEPEAKILDATYTAAAWKSAAYRFGLLVKATGRADLLYGPCFMSRFTLDGANEVGQCWNATEDDLASVCDFIGWDPYNEASGTNDYTAGFQGAAGAAYYLDGLTLWTQANAPGLPVALGEIGFMPNQANLGQRAAWLEAVEAYAVSQRYLCVCYFDASVTSHWWLRRYATTRGDASTLSADTASIAAWAGVYSRNHL